MIRLLLIVTLWTFLSWMVLRFLNRIRHITRPHSSKPPEDPLSRAKKADIIDIE